LTTGVEDQPEPAQTLRRLSITAGRKKEDHPDKKTMHDCLMWPTLLASAVNLFYVVVLLKTFVVEYFTFDS